VSTIDLSKATLADLITVRDASVASRYDGRKIVPIAHFVEDYIAERIDVNCDLQDLLRQRTRLFDYSFIPHHYNFFFRKFIPSVAIHSKKQDERIIRDHYDRGNDFFAGFLGDRMVYTSAFFKNGKEDLETAQDQKMDLVCQKIRMEPGHRHLDIGCGWGTLVAHAAKYYGTDSTGVTIAQAGADFGNQRCEDWGVADRARIHRMDYRSIPPEKYDRITCLEMAEHVGVKYFTRFMKQINSLLTDDGLFYLQIAGLKAGLHKESMVWGLFMSEYIFPGADASMPLSFVVKRLEVAGFEVHSVENVGIHYSQTIQLWYYNWLSNREAILKAYGQWWFRLWEIFLAWSVDIAAQGNSTCFQIVCNKNREDFNRRIWFGGTEMGERDELPQRSADAVMN
jgi:sphingolipid C9-methyltransferase